MSNSNLTKSEFVTVTYRKKHKKKENKAKISYTFTEIESSDLNLSIRRIDTAKEEIVSSEFYNSIKATIRETLDCLNATISEIVCFGLGKVGECNIARYQLALLLCLKDIFKVNTNIFDPIFSQNDIKIIQNYNCLVISDNCEGKYKISSEQNITLFFLPHCPKQLSNNLLWANWGPQLASCIIIANSFNSIVETHLQKTLNNSANYIKRINPHSTELTLKNNFKYQDIFNDLSLHYFAKERLLSIPKEFWCDKQEPAYSECDVEFVTKKY